MAQGTNSLARRIATKTRFVDISNKVTGSTSFNQGDHLIFDDTTNLVRKPTVETEGATYLGIAPVTIVNGKYPPSYVTDVDASVGRPALPGPIYGDVHRVMLKAGDAILPGDRVFLDPASGSRFVSVTGTKNIGVYQGAALTAAAGGTEIEVLIGARFPNDVLEF